MKKSVVIALMSTLLINSVAFGASFNDISNDFQFEKSISWMEKNGVIEGFEDGGFHPEACVTRAEFLKVLYTTLEVDVSEADGTKFSDVKADDWFENFVGHAAETGAINGYPDGTFGPNKCVNNAEAYKIGLLAFLGQDFVMQSDYSFGEENSNKEWFEEYLNSASNSGLDLYDGFSDVEPMTSMVVEIETLASQNKKVSEIKEKSEVIQPEAEIISEEDFYSATIVAGDEMNRAEMVELLYRLKALKDNDGNYYYWGLYPDLLAGVPGAFDECLAGDLGKSGLAVESLGVVNDDMLMSFKMDDSQKADLNAFMANFKEALGEEYSTVDGISEAIAEQEKFDESFNKVFVDGDWEIVAGFDFIEDSYEPTVALGAKFENATDFEKFFSQIMGEEYFNYSDEAVSCSVDGNWTFWSVTGDEFYFARYKDLFFLTNESANIEKMKKAVSANSMFRFNSLFTNVNETLGDKMFNMFVDGQLMLEEGFGGDVDSEMLSSLENIYFDFGVSEKSMDFEALVQLSNAAPWSKMFFNSGYSLSQLVPSKDTVAFMELGSFDAYVDVLSANLIPELNFLGLNFGGFYEMLGDEANIEVSDLELMLDNQVAMRLHAAEDPIAAGAIYIDVTEDDDFEAADRVFYQIANYIDSEIAERGENSGISQMKNVDGQMNMISTGEVYGDLEIYYGFLDGQTFVLSLGDQYRLRGGEESLAANAKFQEAELGNGANFYLDFDQLPKVIEDYESMPAQLKQMLAVLDFFAGSENISGNLIRSAAKLQLK
jgi:hypothetical protein